jgi:hypothetical protein
MVYIVSGDPAVPTCKSVPLTESAGPMGDLIPKNHCIDQQRPPWRRRLRRVTLPHSRYFVRIARQVRQAHAVELIQKLIQRLLDYPRAFRIGVPNYELHPGLRGGHPPG